MTKELSCHESHGCTFQICLAISSSAVTIAKPYFLQKKIINFMLPNLVIIGAMKCGTTSIHNYLSLHPEIFMSTYKELDFFVENKNWRKGISWYESCFNGNASIYGETSPNYTIYPKFQDVPKRMHSVVPDAKLIYIVRDPFERIVSHYLHRWYGNKEKRTINEALRDIENNDYIYLSCYYQQIEQYLKFFKASKIRVIASEELQAKRRDVLKQVFEFLCVDDSFYSEEYDQEHHQTEIKKRKNWFGNLIHSSHPIIDLPRRRLLHKIPPFVKNALRPFSHTGETIPPPVISGEVKERLKNILGEDAERLRRLTGDSFRDWSV